jgi:hypothetical protein
MELVSKAETEFGIGFRRSLFKVEGNVAWPGAEGESK